MDSRSTTELKRISQSWLPNNLKDEMDFVDSSFFKTAGRKLPCPQKLGASREGITIISEMQLVIKFGPRVTIDEAVTMWVVRKYVGHQVPVPELFGWRVYQDTVFIYMELISGVTLEERWSDMDLTDKDSICAQLCNMLFSLRQLQQENTFVGERESHDLKRLLHCYLLGSITRGPLIDRVFYDRPKTGPFNTIDDFYNWLEWLPQRFLSSSQRYKDPYLNLMPKDTTIKFTHADVHPTNIIVSTSAFGPPRVLALIDWGQSGWYPDYWEFFKMCYTTHWEEEWRKTWIPKMIEPQEHEKYLMDEYTATIGAL